MIRDILRCLIGSLQLHLLIAKHSNMSDRKRKLQELAAGRRAEKGEEEESRSSKKQTLENA